MIAHAPQTQFAVAGDMLQLGGLPLVRLAQRVGRTPFYAYERQHIARRVAGLRAALPAGVHLHYAMKANPMPAVVQYLAGLVDGIDVASGGELAIALDTVMPAQRISFAGPGKGDGELSCAVAAGVLINVESLVQLERVALASERLGVAGKVAVRVNPDFSLRRAGMRMGGGAQPFGLDAEQVPALLARLRQMALEFHGLHIYTGSQNLCATALAEAQGQSVELALRLADHAPGPLRVLNIGGGFGVPYFPGDQALDLAPLADGLQRQLDRLQAVSPGTRLNLELGRYLVAESGIYVCKVIERKLSHGQVFLVTDGGLHHHLAASGNFGQLIRKNYPVAIGNRLHGGERELASVVGPLCTPLDLLADQMEMARADTGDLVVVFQSGAYGLTASPTAFLSHPLPAEVLV
ncbi:MULTISPECIES: pyridoxal-dependent decarboxylase, exosortase A system-associated [unclassified Janthinobacterium]|uniref:pyridoxal-dependent decarboxylase, exosortase A system-associated n=1 Tax=unclassified Janthinobacterium TaxID=2610881 RepID=UPI00161E5871|nr:MULTISPECIES: pyridoxal-dependent decarboxylase, exosortase A system-associated [unclassified Janthinobacterium]MBB5606526.1 diaminopimelate decarboxylase [Janthinobacterium sp. S3T4]MBB5611602.1 diaminopimelate decarboxylase [Janthinobacterium sp. S3M3]